MNKNRSDILIQDVYVKHTTHEESPGEYPFTRGVQKTMYQGRLWTMRQYAGFGTAEESNERYRYLLSQGTTGLSVAFDLPTQLGFDADHPRAKGEVGRVGVSLSTLDDMRTLFKDIDLSKISTSMTINATASILLAFYVALADEKKAPLSELRGTVQNDVLKEYVARGNYIYPPKGALRLTTDMFAWCSQYLPKWNPISISGYHIREAGSTAVEELAFTFSNGIAYVEAALKSGLSIDDFAGRLSFFFNVHNDFFEEIAKFRAARRIWAKIMKNRFHAKDERSMMVRFHAQTAGSTLTAQQPMNNVPRVTLQALAAVLGGTQSLHTNGMDEALSLPTEEAAKLALRTQQIIAYESGVTAPADPLGGSWYLETLTDELEEKVSKLMQDIESKGGMIRCIESGYIQNAISSSAYREQKRIEEGQSKIVGVNCFEEENQLKKIPTLKINAELEKRAIEKLRAYKAKRSTQSILEHVRHLKESVSSGQNLQGVILEAVKHQVTLGEISDALREAMGLYQEYAGF